MKTKFSIVLLLLIIGLNCYSVAEPTEPGVNGLGYSPLQAFASDRTEEDINLFNGNIIIRHTDVSAPGVGIPLIITRTYNSNLRYQNCEWSFSVNGINRIETDYPSASNKAIVIYGDGSRQTYFMTGHPSDEGIPLEPGVRDKLIYEDTTNTWVLAKPNGTKITFNFHGLPIKILDKNDNNIRLIRSPLPPFQIVSVFDSAGRYDYTFEYFDADKGLISRIKYKNHEEVEISFSYEYDDNSLLTKVVNPNGRETKYSYELYDTDIYNDFQWKLTEITYSSGAIVKYDYLSFDTIENEEKLNGSICTSEFLQGLQLTKTLKSAENSDEVSTYRFDLVKNTYDEGEACADPYWGRIYLHYTEVTDPNGYLSKFWFEKFYINNTEAAGEFIYTFKMVRSEQPGVVTVNDWVIDGPPHQDWVDKEKLNLEQATRTRKSPEDDQEIDYLESYEYDAYGNITLYTNPLSYIYTYTYLNIDEFNSETPTGLYIIGLQTRQSETLNGNNIEINTEYYDEGNIRGNIERRYLAQISDTRFSYNSKGLVTEKFELNEDLVHSLSYSAEGNLTEVRRNGELFNKYEYYPNGLIKLEFDNLGNYSEFNYDNLGRVLNETRPDKTNISYTLDDINNIVTVDDAGRVTTYYYNSIKRLIKIDEAGLSTTYSYHPGGKIKTITDAEKKTTEYVYDKQYRLIQINYPDGTNSSITYDDGNMKKIVKDPEGNQTIFTMDKIGRIIRCDEPGTNGVTTYEYNGMFNDIARITNARGFITDINYDIYDRYDGCSEGLIKHTSYISSSLVEYTQDMNDNKIYLDYDDFNRIIERKYPDDTKKTFKYFDNDLTEKISYYSLPESPLEIESSTEYVYDSMGRFVQKKDTINDAEYISTYIYYETGELKEITYPSGKKVLYERNDHGWVDTIKYDNKDIAGYEYNNLGNVTQKELTSNYGTISTTKFTYNARGLIDSHQIFKGINQLMYKDDFNYDKNGSIISRAKINGSTTNYTYDPLIRLTSVDYPDANDASYAYDSTGNRVSQQSSYEDIGYNYTGNSDQLSTMTVDSGSNGSTHNYVYDNNGNIISETVSNLSGQVKKKIFSYNYDNLLTRVDFQNPGEPDLNQPGIIEYSISFAYDGEGRRIIKTTPGNTTIYIYDIGGNVIEEYDKTGARQNTFVYAGNRITLAENSTGSIAYYHQDYIGNNIIITDELGEIVTENTLDPFGNMILSQGEEEAHLFTGKERDIETGLDNFGARYYFSELGRFISKDKLIGSSANPQSLNRYIYGSNNPLSNIDYAGYVVITVKGTGSGDESWTPDEEYMNYIQRSLGDEGNPVHPIYWPASLSEANTPEARTAGAKALLEYIDNYTIIGNEKIHIIAHSHGGNIVKEASPSFSQEVQTIITFATPQRVDYEMDMSNVVNYYNVYSNKDRVQLVGGPILTEFLGTNCYMNAVAFSFFFTGRTDDKAKDIEVATKALLFGESHHSNMLSKHVWDQMLKKRTGK